MTIYMRIIEFTRNVIIIENTNKNFENFFAGTNRPSYPTPSP